MGKNETYLIFDNGDIFFSKLFKRGFQHLQILSNDGYNWILFNPGFDQLNYEILPIAADEDAILKYFKDSTVLRVDKTSSFTTNFLGTINILSCVTAAKYFLGINLWAITPYQFYKKLIRSKKIQVEFIQGEKNGFKIPGKKTRRAFEK